MSINEEETRALDEQIILSVLSIITIIISIILLYNDELKSRHKKPFLTSKQVKDLTLFNRLFILLILILFLIINYNLYNISKEKHESLKSSFLQLVASSFTVIAGIIVLYVVLASPDNSIDIENPTI